MIAQFTDSASNTQEAVSASVTAQVRYVDPMLARSIDDTPNANLDIGRIFMMVDSNRSAGSAICNINGGEIDCPPRTQVSLDFGTSGTYEHQGHGDSGYLGSDDKQRSGE